MRMPLSHPSMNTQRLRWGNAVWVHFCSTRFCAVCSSGFNRLAIKFFRLLLVQRELEAVISDNRRMAKI
jgi:hypothetical protein